VSAEAGGRCAAVEPGGAVSTAFVGVVGYVQLSQLEGVAGGSSRRVFRELDRARE